MSVHHPFIFVACLALFFSACKSKDEEPAPTNPSTNPFLIEPGKPALVIAHRGGSDLFPENTLVAFDGAVAMGVDVLEMDVCLTKDSVLVTIHDLTIDGTSDTTGNVIDYTYQELQAFNFGYQFEDNNGNYPYRNNPVRIPRLEDVFGQHPGELMLIEIKDPDAKGMLAADLLVSLIHSFNMQEKVAVASFAYDVLDYFRSINQDSVLTIGSLADDFNFVSAVFANPDTILTLDVDILSLPTYNLLGYNLTSDTVIAAAHRNQIATQYWTVNDKDEMKALIQKGADGIITDKPDKMQEALAELGY